MAKRNLITISTLCTALGVGASVSSALAHADLAERFSALDRNGDGALSAQEFEGHALALFTKADLNHDGKVSREEHNAQHAGREHERFVRDDLNHDGVLDRSEVERMPRAVFSKIDTDKSGGLSPKELSAFAKGRHSEDGLPLDTDGDGAVSQQEMLAKVRAEFVKLDANHDRQLAWEELENDEYVERGSRSGGASEG